MQAFTVHRFWLCSITNEVFIQFSFALKEELKAMEKFFPTKQFALTYIESEKRSWLLIALEDFVLHKKHIIENGNNEDQKKALQICLNALIAYEKKSTENICQLLLKGVKYFEAILPNPNNPSHKSSIDNLNEIIKFCQIETKQNNG